MHDDDGDDDVGHMPGPSHTFSLILTMVPSTGIPIEEREAPQNSSVAESTHLDSHSGTSGYKAGFS